MKQMFITIHDRRADEDLSTNITLLQSWQSKDEIDKNGTTHYLIIYRLLENRLLEEEFTSESDRDDKLNTLSEL